MNLNGIEIERKYLIAMPSQEFLDTLDRTEIVQTYLLGQKGSTERVRKRGRDGNYVYTHTIKRKISSLSRIEEEREIALSEYEELLKRADPERRTIEKLRYCYFYSGMVWEIDVFPFWKDKAFMEIELGAEDQCLSFPSEIRIIKELTEDGRYTNAALAKWIPED